VNQPLKQSLQRDQPKWITLQAAARAREIDGAAATEKALARRPHTKRRCC
jgi:hypothetical protein